MNDAYILVSEAMEKSLEPGGRKRRILGGYAAGTGKDFQDEQFLMKGMNWDYLNSNQGKINWDHDSDIIIGRPIQCGMFEKGLYVKGMLSEKADYPNPTHPNTVKALDRAEWAWDYAMRNQADPDANPPLAWSVEGGKANQGSMIVKSIVTDVALTDKAVNPNDCTVSALAKSFRENTKVATMENVATLSGIPFEELDEEIFKTTNVESFMKLCKSIGFSVDQSVNLYNNVRGRK